MSILFEERPIDRHLAEFICTGVIGGREAEILRLLVSMASNAVGKGNICLDLHHIAEQSVTVEGRVLLLPSVEGMVNILKQSAAVGTGEEHRPLVLDAARRLYLYRYWRYEQDLAREIVRRAGKEPSFPIDEGVLQEGLLRLFSGGDGPELDLQRKAASVALHRRFSVISGGPGTGKTSTVVRIIALLLEQAGGRHESIAMAAPTGKSAARLRASVGAIRESLDCPDEVKAAISDEVVTIHRLLGPLQGSVRFRHSKKNPLSFDTVIVDEASMVALPLMAALVTALKPSARLILLGDRDQLASVDAGAVLGDLCRAAEEGSSALLHESLVILEKNYRFQAGSGIGAISRAVNGGRDGESLALLKSGSFQDVSWQKAPPDREALRRLLSGRVIDPYRKVLEASTAALALERFDRFRILCALRDGPFGVSGFNSLVESILGSQRLLDPSERWYRGRPLLITSNSYSMQLFNGDIGMIFPDPLSGGELMAFFPGSEGEVRRIPPERLPQHETAFAMTIHKSQGSEFDRVLMVLPSADSDLLTRELLYTGITRAKQGVEIWCSEEIFTSTVKRKSERNSGFMSALLQ